MKQPIEKKYIEQIEMRNRVIDLDAMRLQLLMNEREEYLQKIIEEMKLDQEQEWKFDNKSGAFITKEETDGQNQKPTGTNPEPDGQVQAVAK